MKYPNYFSYYRLKVLLVRILINAVVLALVILLVPQIYLINWSYGTLLVMAVALGILNAVVKPIMQFITMPFIFASYGLVVLLVNTLVLYLMDYYFPERIEIGGLFGALLGGLLIGVLGSFLENLFGLARPILPDDQSELRRRVYAEDRGILAGLLARSRVEKLNKLAALKASSQLPPEPDEEVMREITTPDPMTNPDIPQVQDGTPSPETSSAGGEQ